MRTLILGALTIAALTFVAGCGGGEQATKPRRLGVAMDTGMAPPIDPPGPVSGDTTYGLGTVSGPVMYDATSGKLYVSKVSAPRPQEK